MPSRFYIIFIIPVVIYLSACKKYVCPADAKYYCTDGSLDVVFAGFTSAQTDSLYVVHYIKGGNFSVIVDTLLCYTEISKNSVLLTWTANQTPYGGLINPVDANYDSEIIIPGAPPVRFSNILISTAEYECCANAPGLGCGHNYNFCPITSYQQNGDTMTVVPAIVTN